MPNTYKMVQYLGEESEYESENETKYIPEKNILGKGTYSIARRLVSRNKRKIKVVLKPHRNKCDIEEARAKRSFFQALYPEEQAQLYILYSEKTSNKEIDYRLVIPFITGKSYQELYENHIIQRSQHDQLALFISSVEELIRVATLNYVVLDLKRDNIYYDEKDKKSHLIDGGIAAAVNTPVCPDIFICDDEHDIFANRKQYPHIAPECWNTVRVLANEKMDVYSLGYMMNSFCKGAHLNLTNLIKDCLNVDPKLRPTLSFLLSQLKQLVQDEEKAIQAQKSNFNFTFFYQPDIKKRGLSHAENRNLQTPTKKAIFVQEKKPPIAMHAESNLVSKPCLLGSNEVKTNSYVKTHRERTFLHSRGESFRNPCKERDAYSHRKQISFNFDYMNPVHKSTVNTTSRIPQKKCTDVSYGLQSNKMYKR